MIPDRLRAAFETQARACEKLGSPFMARLNTLCATRDWPDGTIRDRLATWAGDLSPRGASVPLRLAGALHALSLSGNPRVRAIYPPIAVTDDVLWGGVCDVLITEAAFIDAFIDSPPQTNEVRRAAVLIAAGHWLAAHYDLPIRMYELGASAGLNLMWDKFALKIGADRFGPDTPALTLTPDWEGAPPPPTRPNVIDRRGVDLNPLDPVADSLRLRAYIWPDQPERLTLTDAAIACQRATVDKSDAIDWLALHLDPIPGQLRMIYHTIAWQYFPDERQDTGRRLIEAAGAAATPASPLAWLGMEADDTPDGAGLRLRLWPGDLTVSLGRVDFHGRWVRWTAPDPHTI